MTPLWKIRSGQFAGWHSDDALYNAEGVHVGYLAGHVVYDLRGQVVGELVDADWIGRQAQAKYPPGEPQPQRESVAHAPLANRTGRNDLAWSDPEL
ncbi:MAG: 4-fold beta flower protein [Pirellulales bacterium]